MFSFDLAPLRLPPPSPPPRFLPRKPFLVVSGESALPQRLPCYPVTRRRGPEPSPAGRSSPPLVRGFGYACGCGYGQQYRVPVTVMVFVADDDPSGLHPRVNRRRTSPPPNLESSHRCYDSVTSPSTASPLLPRPHPYPAPVSTHSVTKLDARTRKTPLLTLMQ